MKMFEIIGHGFHGGTDETDDRILWVQAPSQDLVQDLLDRTLYRSVEELPEGYDEMIDYRLPEDIEALRLKLKTFKG